MRTGRPLIELDRDQLISLYQSGISSFRIAPLFGVSWATIIRRLHKWGIPIRLQYPSWNRGLTTLTDERVKQNSDKTSRMRGHKHTRKVKQQMSQSRKGQNTWSKGSIKSEIVRQHNSEASKKMWRDPTYIQRVINGLHLRPTKPEKYLKIILDNHFPDFKYNGDYSLGISLNGQIPDFVNCNGRKEVIEVFGDYWHSPAIVGNQWRRSELGTLMAYNSIGFRCLIIWENELKILQEDEIITRIKQWTGKHITHVSPKA